MKTFFKIIVIMVLVFLLGGVGRVSWLCYKEPSLVRAFFAQTELTFKDESQSVEWDPHYPKVIAPTVSLKKLLSEARIKRMRLRRSAAIEFVASWRGLSRPTALVVNISTFAGPYDKGVGKNELGSIFKKKLRSIDPTKIRGMAWFMTDFSEENPNSPIKVPSVETWLGGGAKTLKERIANANKALGENYVVMVTSLDESGRVIAGPFEVILADRGPNTRFEKPRADAFWKTWNDLGVLDSTEHPNSDDHKVNLVVQIVHKDNLKLQLPSRDITMN